MNRERRVRPEERAGRRGARRRRPRDTPRRGGVREFARRFAALVVIVSLALSGILGIGARRTSAVEPRYGDSVYLSVGSPVFYGGLGLIGTARMSVNGNVAYCSDPSRTTPKSGYYTRSQIQTHENNGSVWPVSTVEKVLFYGYGGPGFDADLWRGCIGGTDLDGRHYASGLDWDGTTITDDEFFAYTHILVADRMWCDAAVALERTSTEFKEWFHWNILGYTYGHDGSLENRNSVGTKIDELTLPDGFETFQLDTGYNSAAVPGGRSQTIVGFEYHPNVEVTFDKVSANATVTSGNEEYGYADAVYEIYEEATDERVARITTDENGRATYQLKPNTSYYALEVEAPKGFVKSTERVPFTTGTGPSSVALSDIPGMLELIVQKKDSATLGPAQAGATLKGAEYKVVDANGTSHMGTTDESGHVSFSGLPLGLVTVTEVTAPEGYKLSGEIRTYEVGSDELPSTGVIELVPEDDFVEDVIAFDVDLVKYADSGAEGSGLQKPASGVEFQIVSNTTTEVVATLETDERGYATTEGSWYGSGERPDGVEGALPYDRLGYTIHEVAETTPEGYQPVGDWTISPEQMVDGVTLHYIADNDFVRSRIQVVKVDASSGRTIPLAGFSFQLLDESGQTVSQEVWYPNHETMDVFTTDDSGCVTFPGALVPGTYHVREVDAQPPYLISGDDLTVTIEDSAETETISVITFADEQAWGEASISKRCAEEALEDSPALHDEGCPGTLRGAEFDVVATHDVICPDGTVAAVEGEIVDHVETGEDGTATSRGLSLGSGSVTYAFVETVPPVGHALDPTPHEFTLTYESPQTSVVTAEVDATNVPTTIILDKRVLGTERPLGNVTFALWSEDEADASDIPASSLLTTAEDGIITLRHLEPGTYFLREVSGPGGYLVSDETLSFVIDAHGMVEGSPTHRITVENDFTKILLSKRDITTEEEVPGAKLTLLDGEGQVVDTWVSSEEPHLIEALPEGTYTLVEEMTPHTYDMATAVEFSVASTGEVQTVVMYDQPIQISGELDKRQEIADPTHEGTEADSHESEGGSNRAAVSVSPEGAYDYSVDVRSTSTTWVDEFTLTDDIDAARDGLAELVGITTPVAAEDYDGLLNVWYRTNLSEQGLKSEGDANATLSDGHENPWLTDESTAETLGDDGRAISYEGWRLWAESVSALEATELLVADLPLEEGERVISVRLEYGRVEPGFTTRSDGWERPDLKDVHDDLDDVAPTHEGDRIEDKIERAPLKISMRVTDAYQRGTVLANHASIETFRNGGGCEKLEDHDADRVEQLPVETSEPQEPPEDLPKAGDSSPLPAAVMVPGVASVIVSLMHRRRR